MYGGVDYCGYSYLSFTVYWIKITTFLEVLSDGIINILIARGSTISKYSARL